MTMSLITLLTKLLPGRAERNLQYAVVTLLLTGNSTFMVPPLSLLKNLLLTVKFTPAKKFSMANIIFQLQDHGKKRGTKNKQTLM